MGTSEQKMSYIAVMECGCVSGICSDDPRFASEIADWIKQGLIIQHVTKEEAVERFVADCPHQEIQLSLI